MKVFKTISLLFREYRPFKFFSLVAAVLGIVALGLFLPVFIDYLHTGLVMRFPTLIMSGIIAVLSILLWVCGIILEVIVKKHRQLYELILNQIKKDEINK